MGKWIRLWLAVFLCLPFLAGIIYIEYQKKMMVQPQTDGIVVVISDSAGTRKISENDYIEGVMAAEISPDYEMETLKAQAVLIRSSLYARANGRSIVEADIIGRIWYDHRKQKIQWGSGYISKHARLLQAVDETAHQVIYYDGHVVDPPFFSVGNGMTRSAEEAWGLDVPWLSSVESPWDVCSDYYEQTIVKTRKQLITLLKESIPDFNCPSDTLPVNCHVTRTDMSGYVLELQAGNKILTGDEFRYALGLTSTCFEIVFEQNLVNIRVKGVGHGVGFDQFGANEQAKEGKNFEKLLMYYLSGVKVSE